jgi:hypothetical protein
MLYCFKREGQTLLCEVRHSADDTGFELVVIGVGQSHTERFRTITALLAREHELTAAWRALGWQLDCGVVSRGRQEISGSGTCQTADAVAEPVRIAPAGGRRDPSSPRAPA